MAKVTLFWFRRDLRLEDNAGLYHALKERTNVLPIFIFDADILSKLDEPADARVQFIHQSVASLKTDLRKSHSDILVRHGKPLEIIQKILSEFDVEAIYTNCDYEPEARRRDEAVAKLCRQNDVEFLTFKDQCLFEKDEILSGTLKPYTVYTPYKKKVLSCLTDFYLRSYPTLRYEKNFLKISRAEKMPTLSDLGFKAQAVRYPSTRVSPETLKKYARQRDFPSLHGTSLLGLHLRFGTVSVRELARLGKRYSPVWLSELIWRDFFMQILWHFPHVQKKSFREKYDKIAWRKSKKDFQKWSEGRTGYPLVDAGMRELNETGFMHNRVRMVTASFLTKHLLIHWYEGERYFAGKLLDYDLSANNGNWQWAAGSGCDAAPYFRVFNPLTQAKKFDPQNEYIKKWIPEYGTDKYPAPMIQHEEARSRCLQAYVKALKGN